VITKEQAQRLALEHLDRLDLRGFRYELKGVVSRPQHAEEWAVLFDIYTPDGRALDGPAVFVVDRASGAVRRFNDS